MTEVINIACNLPWHDKAIWLLIAVIIREIIWKGIALWKAGEKKQLTWFICLFIFNTVGILPIIYLITRKKDK
jgi:hypothetical protein